MGFGVDYDYTAETISPLLIEFGVMRKAAKKKRRAAPKAPAKKKKKK